MGVSPTALVTGATSGLGLETAIQLAASGARVLVHGRNEERVARALELVRASGEEQSDGVVADLSSLAEVRTAAARTLELAPRLDVLVNNAAVFMTTRGLSADGFEMTFAVNHLAHFLLTNILLDRLVASAPARVVTVTSVAHFRGKVDLDSLGDPNDFDEQATYATSKLMNVMFAFELAERLSGSGVTSNCIHPGVVDTKLLHTGFPGSQGVSPAEAAQAVVWLATGPQAQGVNRTYFAGRRATHAAPKARDADARRRLWEASARLVGLDE